MMIWDRVLESIALIFSFYVLRQVPVVVKKACLESTRTPCAGNTGNAGDNESLAWTILW